MTALVLADHALRYDAIRPDREGAMLGQLADSQGAGR
jgi:hypothetical protein